MKTITSKFKKRSKKGMACLLAVLFSVVEIAPLGGDVFASSHMVNPATGQVMSTRSVNEISSQSGTSSQRQVSAGVAFSRSGALSAATEAISVPSDAKPVNCARRSCRSTTSRFLRVVNGKIELYRTERGEDKVDRVIVSDFRQAGDVIKGAGIFSNGDAVFFLQNAKGEYRYEVIDVQKDKVSHISYLGEEDRIDTTNAAHTVLHHSGFQTEKDNYFSVFKKDDGRFVGVAGFQLGPISHNPPNPPVKVSRLVSEIRNLTYDGSANKLKGVFDGQQRTFQVQVEAGDRFTETFIRLGVDRSDSSQDVLVMNTDNHLISGRQEVRIAFKNTRIEKKIIFGGSVVVQTSKGIEVIPSIEYIPFRSETHQFRLKGDEIVSVKQYQADAATRYKSVGFYEITTRGHGKLYRYLMKGSEVIDLVEEAENPVLAAVVKFYGGALPQGAKVLSVKEIYGKQWRVEVKLNHTHQVGKAQKQLLTLRSSQGTPVVIDSKAQDFQGRLLQFKSWTLNKVLIYRLDASYHSNGRIKENRYTYYHRGSLIKSVYSVSLYDSNGRTLKSTYERFFLNGNKQSRLVTSYSNGKPTSYYSLSYHSNGRLKEYRYTRYYRGSYRRRYQSVSVYDVNGRILKNTYERFFTNGKKQNSTETRYANGKRLTYNSVSYHSNGKATLNIFRRYSGGKLYYQSVLRRDSNGRYLSFRSSYYRTQTGVRYFEYELQYTKRTYYYRWFDARGKLTRETVRQY